MSQSNIGPPYATVNILTCEGGGNIKKDKNKTKKKSIMEFHCHDRVMVPTAGIFKYTEIEKKLKQDYLIEKKILDGKFSLQ